MAADLSAVQAYQAAIRTAQQSAMGSSQDAAATGGGMDFGSMVTSAIADTGHLIDALGYGISEGNLDTGLLFNAKARLSDAAQEGISAFLEKRSPAWKPAS